MNENGNTMDEDKNNANGGVNVVKEGEKLLLDREKSRNGGQCIVN